MPFDGAIRRKPKKAATSGLWLAYRGSKLKKMETKMLGTLTIAGLIAMSVLVGTAAANSVVGIKAYNKTIRR